MKDTNDVVCLGFGAEVVGYVDLVLYTELGVLRRAAVIRYPIPCHRARK